MGSAPFARHYWGYHVCFLFLRLLRCFSSPRSPPFLEWMTGLRPAGLPHSEIGGSKAACASPPLFAACHVLHRLPEPRHPPCALSFFRRRCPAETGNGFVLTLQKAFCSAHWSTRYFFIDYLSRYDIARVLFVYINSENLLSFCSNMSMNDSRVCPHESGE